MEEKRKGGRPAYDLNWDYIDSLLEAGCSGNEVAANLGMDPSTFYRHVQNEKRIGLTDYARIQREKGDSNLRKAQFKNAIKGNTTMQIWLGKQRLEQRDTDKQDPSLISIDEVIKSIKKGTLLDEIEQREGDE